MHAIPILPVLDIDDSVEFYRHGGFDVDLYDVGYAFVIADGHEVAHLTVTAGLDPATNPSAMYLHTTRVQELHDAWQQAGVDVSDVVVQPWGMREFSVRDPGGNLVRVGTNA